MITDEKYFAACQVGTHEQELYEAVAVRYDDVRDAIVIKLARGVEVSVPRLLLQGLSRATAADLRAMDLNASGTGLHLESLDWDMSISGILHGQYGSPRWMRGLAGEEPRARPGPSRH